MRGKVELVAMPSFAERCQNFVIKRNFWLWQHGSVWYIIFSWRSIKFYHVENPSRVQSYFSKLLKLRPVSKFNFSELLELDFFTEFFFIGRVPFLSPNQKRQSNEENRMYTFEIVHKILYFNDTSFSNI